MNLYIINRHKNESEINELLDQKLKLEEDIKKVK